jgi:hypothetical protein
MEIHCKEVEQMLESPPKAVYRWGNSILLIFIGIVYALSLVLKFPVTVNAELTLQFDTTQGKWVVHTPLPANTIPGEQVIIALEKYPPEKYGFISNKIGPGGELALAALVTDRHVTIMPAGNIKGNAIIITGYQSLLARITGR